MINHDKVALMASTAYSIPSLIDIAPLPTIDRGRVMEMVEMFMDEAIVYINELGLKPLPVKYIKENVYMLCNDILDHIGEFEGGSIPQASILKYVYSCDSATVLHSHPIPMPIPTLEDMVSSYQIGYNTECVISKVSNYLAIMVCLKPSKTWMDIISAFHSVIEDFLKTSKYIVVGDSSQIEFLPFPDTVEQNSMVRLFIDSLVRYAEIFYVRIDLLNKIYDVEIFD